MPASWGSQHGTENARRCRAHSGREYQARAILCRKGKRFYGAKHSTSETAFRSPRQLAKDSWDAPAYLSRLLIEGDNLRPAVVEE
jgi:hypothetical protein